VFVVVIKLGILAAVALFVLHTVFGYNLDAFVQAALKRLSLLANRCARMCAPNRSGLAETLQVELQATDFSDPDSDGECQGVVRLVVNNTSEFLIERLSVNVRLDSEMCGSFHTARENYKVRLSPGESASLELDVGFVHHTQLKGGYQTNVQVIGAHALACEIPTYVLPESCVGVCSIGESFGITSDVTVERIGISIKKRMFGKGGQVNVSYVVRNQGQAFHEGMSLVTRLLSTSGRSIAQHESTFDVIPWGERRISVVLDIARISQLTAAQFGAEFRGFEEIAIGMGEWSQMRRAPVEAAPSELEEWHGEEVRDTLWVERS
jgi:hypothetical protein